MEQGSAEIKQELAAANGGSAVGSASAGICPGLNELTDTLQAYPNDIISYFTLLKEIDAKCITTIPHLQAYIQRFLQMSPAHPKREKLLLRIRDVLKDLMPCLEEKMHVATIASDLSIKHLRRLEMSFDLIVSGEIPELVRIGPMWEPSMKVSEPKSAQQQRSETRREAIAAKRGSSKPSANANSFVYQDEYDSQVDDSATPGPSNTHSNGNGGGQGRKPRGAARGTKRKRQTSGVPQQTAHQQSAQANNVSVAESYEEDEESQQQQLQQQQQQQQQTSKPKRTRNKAKKENLEEEHDVSGEPLYCYCQQVSYGEMVGCDGEHCEREWFHLPCIGLSKLPVGEWYCDDCKR